MSKHAPGGVSKQALRVLAAIARRLPIIGGWIEEQARLRRDGLRFRETMQAVDGLWVPPGHFYSPIPSREDIKAAEHAIYASRREHLPGIDLRVPDQLDLIERLGGYYAAVPFGSERQPGVRYYFDNPYFDWGDGITLYCMMRHCRPRRVVEVGSGFSSALMLDVSDLFLNRTTDFTFIDPNPERLLSLLRPEDEVRVVIHKQVVQSVNMDVFKSLVSGDILFIDSSHVSKVHSDVNFLFFEVLPTLAPGVLIHIHDIAWPFEYPLSWVQKGIAYSEAYLARSFLQYNSDFRIQFFLPYLAEFHRPAVQQHLPLTLRNPGGSLWLKRTA